jgi:hypothetical protein
MYDSRCAHLLRRACNLNYTQTGIQAASTSKDEFDDPAHLDAWIQKTDKGGGGGVADIAPRWGAAMDSRRRRKRPRGGLRRPVIGKAALCLCVIAVLSLTAGCGRDSGSDRTSGTPVVAISTSGGEFLAQLPPCLNLRVRAILLFGSHGDSWAAKSGAPTALRNFVIGVSPPSFFDAVSFQGRWPQAERFNLQFDVVGDRDVTVNFKPREIPRSGNRVLTDVGSMSKQRFDELACR